MLHYLRLGIVIGMLCLLAGCGPVVAHKVPVSEPGQKPGMFEVTGQITYRERVALPPQSIAVVTLRDVTTPNAASTVIAEQRTDLAGRQVPVDFRVAVDRSTLLPERRYSIRGSIISPDQQVLWVTNEQHIVDPSKPSVAAGTLTVSRVTGEAADPGERLRSGEWTVVKINGMDIPAGARGTLTFGANAVLSGRSFCNSFTGTYVLSGTSLSLSPRTSTLMACPPEVANFEKQFVEMLGDVQRFEMSEFGTLTLRTSDLRTITASKL